MTIGLEGQWGSGKSTVVNILNKRIKEEQPDTKYFYFDAWEHEGDPLRRIFLEELIDQTDPNNEDLKNLKNRITNKIKIKQIKSTQSVTNFGKLLALSAFFVPLGAAIASSVVSDVTFLWTGEFHYLFIVSVLFSLAPLFVAFCNFLFLLWKRKAVINSKSWAFLQADEKTTLTQETSEDEERTSIEFEMFFKEILKIISPDERSKMIIVIDNLDRINSHDSLRIWSTLQTYLQRRNPGTDNFRNFNDIWTIVPYDENGLKRIWDKSDDVQGQDTICSKSFFDKCFQLRLEVPKLIISSWEKYCKECMLEALIGWDDDEIERILSVFKWTRKSICDSPSPREIKTFINQVGIIRASESDNFSVESISYYVIQKYLHLRSKNELEQDLSSGKIPEDNLKLRIDVDITAELSGLLYGVPAEVGQQIILEPIIEKALINKEMEKVNEILNKYETAFFVIFDLHLRKVNDFNRLLKYSDTIWNSIFRKTKSKCKNFVKKLHANCIQLKEEAISLKNEETIVEYNSMLSLLAEYKINNFVLLRILGEIVVEKLSQNKDLKFWLNVLNGFFKMKYPSIDSLKIQTEKITIDTWLELTKICKENSIEIRSIIVPEKKVFDSLSTKINPGQEIPLDLSLFLDYWNGIVQIDEIKIIESLINHFNWKNGQNINNVFTKESFYICYQLFLISEDSIEKLKELFRIGSFWNCLFQLKETNSVRYVAAVFAMLYPSEIQNFQIVNVGNSPDGFQLVSMWWNEEDEENAMFFWNLIERNAEYSILWSIMNSGKFILIKSILKIAIEKQVKDFFITENDLISYKKAFIFVDAEYKDKLAKAFIKLTKIENAILDNNFNLSTELSESFFYILKNSKKKTLIKKTLLTIEMLKKESWITAFEKNTYVTSILDYLIDGNYLPKLDKDYCETLIGQIKRWCIAEHEPTDWQIDKMNKLIDIMPQDYKQHLSDVISRLLPEQKFKIADVMKDVVFKNINHKLTFSERKDELQKTLEHAITDGDIDTLLAINEILNEDSGRLFNPLKKMKRLFTDTFSELISEQNDEKKKAELMSLAKKNNIEPRTQNEILE